MVLLHHTRGLQLALALCASLCFAREAPDEKRETEKLTERLL